MLLTTSRYATSHVYGLCLAVPSMNDLKLGMAGAIAHAPICVAHVAKIQVIHERSPSCTLNISSLLDAAASRDTI